MKSAAELIRLAFERPTHAIAVLWMLSKGYWVKVYFPLTGRRFKVGRNFRLQGSLRIRGPGKVIFGDDMIVDQRVTPFTHSVHAEIRVGNRVQLNGTRFGCAERITIGDDCLISEARIADTNFHSVQPDRRCIGAKVLVSPVVVSNNVWIGPATAILPGTRIGENSVVGFGAICSGTYAANMLISGPAARSILRIDD